MKQLIKISEQNGRQAVSARELHKFFEVTERFSNWFSRQLQYGFVENADYVGCKEFNTLANQELTDYALTLNCAKEISMLQRSERGKQARQYFIACEEKLKQASKPLTQIEVLAQSVQLLVEQDKRIGHVEEKVKELDARTQTRPEYFTIVGYASLNNISVNIKSASSIGRTATTLCKQRGMAVDDCPDPRFGRVHMYPKQVLAEVFSMPIAS